MNSVDFVLFGIVLVSAVIGLWRGLVREVMSVATWIVAVWAAFVWAEIMAPALAGLVATPALRVAAAFVLIFVTLMIAGSIVTRLLTGALSAVGLGGVNRVAGAAFGVVRGALVVAAVVYVVGLTSFAQGAAWQQSKAVEMAQGMIHWFKGA